MTHQVIIQKTTSFVKEKLKNAEVGHDRRHSYRVRKNTLHIAKKEKDVDLLIIELGALLHDIADYKFHDGDENIGPKTAQDRMQKLNLDQKTIDAVVDIIQNISFKGKDIAQPSTREGLIVQDADRLDAMGAITIARTFTFCGYFGRPIHNPNIKPKLNMTPEEYKKHKAEGTGINHFYEKLLLLKDLMNTETGKQIAQHRHHYMEEFLEEFLAEREGQK